jgi:hypothetical protein
MTSPASGFTARKVIISVRSSSVNALAASLRKLGVSTTVMGTAAITRNIRY